MSTSPAKSLRLFPALSVYNLINNNKSKRDFDTAFINFCPLAGNNDQEEVGLSFAGCGCPDAVKLNRS